MAKLSLFDRRRQRVRTALKARSGGRPRLSIHRSGRHIYAQIIDDAKGRTIAASSSLLKGEIGANVDAAAKVGTDIAEKAKDRKSTRLNSSHVLRSRMPSSA